MVAKNRSHAVARSGHRRRLEIVEVACRDNAARCRRKGAIEEAQRRERTADNITRRRTAR